MMRRSSRNWYLLFFLLGACTRSGVRQTPSPLPLPAIPNPPVALPAGDAWTFNYSSGTATYQVARSAAVESQLDSGLRREISTNATHELLILDAEKDTIRFTAVVDTFSTTTQGLIGPAQAVQLPVKISGLLTSDSLFVESDSLSKGCSPVRSALVTDLHNLLVRFPGPLSKGLRWRDSTELTGCQGMIPTTAQIIKSYLVFGVVEYQGSSVLVVQRADTVRARGEGAQQQHRITIDVNGTGNATYYIDLKDQSITRVVSDEDLNFTIVATGRTNRFRQSLKQDFSLLR